MNSRLASVSTDLSRAKKIASKTEKINVVSAQNVYNKAKELLNSSNNAKKLYAQTRRKKGALDKIPKIKIDFERAGIVLSQASESIYNLQKVLKTITTFGLRQVELEKMNLRSKKTDENLEVKKQELENLLESTDDICPFCNQEISVKCKEEILAGV